MFSSVFQKGTSGVEIFSPTGKDPFKFASCRADLNTAKFYDRSIKGYAVVLDSEGHSPVFQTPKKDSESLGIVQSILCLQLQRLPGKSCSVEFIVRDDAKQRRRLHFSTKFREKTCNPLHAQLPWTVSEQMEEMWITWVVDLDQLCQSCFHSSFVSLEQMRIYGSSRLRKVFSLPAGALEGVADPSGLMLPAAMDFPIGTQTYRLLIAGDDRGDHMAAPPSMLSVVGTKPSASKPALAAANARLRALDKGKDKDKHATPERHVPEAKAEVKAEVKAKVSGYQGPAAQRTALLPAPAPPAPSAKAYMDDEDDEDTPPRSPQKASSVVAEMQAAIATIRQSRSSLRESGDSISSGKGVLDNLPSPVPSQAPNPWPLYDRSRPSSAGQGAVLLTSNPTALPIPSSSRPGSSSSRPASASAATSAALTIPSQVPSRPASAVHAGRYAQHAAGSDEEEEREKREEEHSVWRHGQHEHTRYDDQHDDGLMDEPFQLDSRHQGYDEQEGGEGDEEEQGAGRRDDRDYSDLMQFDDHDDTAYDEEDPRIDEEDHFDNGRDHEPLHEQEPSAEAEAEPELEEMYEHRFQGYMKYEQALHTALNKHLPDQDMHALPAVQHAEMLLTHLQNMEDAYITTFGARPFQERLGYFFQ